MEECMVFEESEIPSAELEELDVQMWNLYWGEIERRISSLFARSDARSRAISYLQGLLSCGTKE